MADKQFLDHAYGLETVEDTVEFYADWADTYDAELVRNGYVTPQRCAEALARHMPDKSGAVMDVGCGTGLSGAALKRAGFDLLEGCDVTEEMLRGARDRGLYRHLWVNDPDQPLELGGRDYAAFAAIGVIGLGAARLELYHDIVAQMPKGAFFVWSFNNHTYAHPEFEGAMQRYLDVGETELLEKTHGPHIPGKDMTSNVYVIRKL